MFGKLQTYPKLLPRHVKKKQTTENTSCNFTPAPHSAHFSSPKYLLTHCPSSPTPAVLPPVPPPCRGRGGLMMEGWWEDEVIHGCRWGYQHTPGGPSARGVCYQNGLAFKKRLDCSFKERDTHRNRDFRSVFASFRACVNLCISVSSRDHGSAFEIQGMSSASFHFSKWLLLIS